jgi:hypothetical protein
MVSYFIGGALGSWLGAICWAYKGWGAVCGLSLLVLAIAMAVFARGTRGREALLVGNS